MSEHRDTGDRLKVVHVLDAIDVEDRTTHFRGAPDRFIDGFEAGDLSDPHRHATAGEHDEDEHRLPR